MTVFSIANGTQQSSGSSNPFSSTTPSAPLSLPSTTTGRPMVDLDNLSNPTPAGTNANPFTQVNATGWSNQAPKPSLDELARSKPQQQQPLAIGYQGSASNPSLAPQSNWQGQPQSTNAFGATGFTSGTSNPFGGALI